MINFDKMFGAILKIVINLIGVMGLSFKPHVISHCDKHTLKQILSFKNELNHSKKISHTKEAQVTLFRDRDGFKSYKCPKFCYRLLHHLLLDAEGETEFPSKYKML